MPVNPMPPKPVQRQQLRLVHLLASPEAGGAEQFFLRLMLALAQRPEDAVVYPIVREGSWIATELRRAGIRHETAGFSGLFPWFTRAKVARVAKTWRATSVTAWMKRASQCTPRVKIPTVGRLGGYYDLSYFKGRVKNLVCNTPDICHYARENGWPGDRVDYLPNFVPTPPVGWKNNRADMRAFLKIPPNGFVLFIAARLHRVKGIDIAIEALERLDARYHLVVVGNGPEEKNLKALADRLKLGARVHWAGWQSNISGWASAADVWLVPSREEPLGNVVLDAWAHGIPVIASRTKGPLHLIEHGVSGRLATTGSVADLANEIKEITERRALSMHVANGGTMAWRQKFTDTVVVEQWLEYYEKLSRGEDTYE